MLNEKTAELLFEILRAWRDKKRANERQPQAIESDVPVGFPVGSTVYRFDVDKGVFDYLVVSKNRVFDGTSLEYAIASQPFSDTRAGAIRNALSCEIGKAGIDQSLKKEIFESLKGSIEWDVDYYRQQVTDYRLALDILERINRGESTNNDD